MAMDGLGRLFDINLGFVPVDMETAANTGKWVSLTQCAGVNVVWFKAAGTAGDDPTLTLQQAQDSAGTGAKNLAIITTYYLKDAATLAASTLWTKLTQAAAATIADPGGAGTSAEHQQIGTFYVPGTALDLANGFTHINCSIADTGANPQLGCILYLRGDLEVMRTPANLASQA